MKKHRLLIIILIILFSISACAPKAKTPLVVFAAGSLIQPFGELEKAFEEKYPEIDVTSEYHGSIQVMRHVTELHEEIDIVATADQSLIPMLMYQVNIPDTEQPYANWYISMATNQLGIAYRPESKYADEITSDNWWEVLSRPDVRVGLADPRFDAVGYRTLMVLSLAQNVYGNEEIFDNFLNGQLTYPIKLIDMGDVKTIRVPEIVETTKDAHILVRGSSTALISLLEAGEVDYAFEYKSVIKQHGFDMLELPPSLNLGEADLDDQYGKVTVQMDFQRFASVNPVFQGEQIKYGITIPTNAPHPDEAALFIQFLYSPEGQAIMQKDSHPLLIPISVDQPANLPEALRNMLGSQ
ncbi:MAG: tungstate ABC transporter substrate-binding protein WtpA [Anaerolineaceae bacterium]